jgi:hypothetical protein
MSLIPTTQEQQYSYSNDNLQNQDVVRIVRIHELNTKPLSVHTSAFQAEDKLSLDNTSAFGLLSSLFFFGMTIIILTIGVITVKIMHDIIHFGYERYKNKHLKKFTPLSNDQMNLKAYKRRQVSKKKK